MRMSSCVRAIALLLCGVVVPVEAQMAVPGADLLRSIREGETARVRELLQLGFNANARDPVGATALMYASAFAPPEHLRLLLDAGADPNGADNSGATPLMWATHDAEKVRLLIAAGADVTATRADGVTALITAALRGRPDVMRLLVDAGANPREGAATAPWRMELPGIVLTTNDPAMHAWLDPEAIAPAQLAQWTPPPLLQWMLTPVLSWRPQPAASHVSSLRVLLDAGADPNETIPQMALTVPLLSRVLGLGDSEAVRLLLDRGANPDTPGTGGVTPLMMAAVRTPDAAHVTLLLEKGANVHARDERGRTALDWALRLGDTEASRVLRAAGARALAVPEPQPPVVDTPREAGAALTIALERLQPAGPRFYERTRCISCHNQSLPAVAVTLARVKGVIVDPTMASHPTRATLEVWARSREQMLLGNCSVFGFLPNVAYGLFGFAEEGVAQSAETDAVASCLSGLQKPDGSWDGGDTRPPLSASRPIVFTALAMRGLSTYAGPGRREETAVRTARALAFLRQATPEDTQDAAFKLLGLIWGRASSSEIAAQTARVLALRRPDGGWGQLPTMPPDAYATGQALYALRVAGTAASHDAYRRGVAFLLRTQLADGTWHVRSRAIGFQPYVDAGFAHGPDQFISAAATAWAAIALSHVL